MVPWMIYYSAFLSLKHIDKAYEMNIFQGNSSYLFAKTDTLEKMCNVCWLLNIIWKFFGLAEVEMLKCLAKCREDGWHLKKNSWYPILTAEHSLSCVPNLDCLCSITANPDSVMPLSLYVAWEEML